MPTQNAQFLCTKDKALWTDFINLKSYYHIYYHHITKQMWFNVFREFMGALLSVSVITVICEIGVMFSQLHLFSRPRWNDEEQYFLRSLLDKTFMIHVL